ncbi:MAG: MBL fold metallo-hydrolase [Candidatus Hodarchaeales archaeon]
MKTKILAVVIVTVVVFTLIAGSALILTIVNNTDQRVIVDDNFLFYKGVNITWTGWASFKLKMSNLIVYIDPYSIPLDSESADIIIITHNHKDHLDPTSIEKICDNNTFLYTPESVHVDRYSTTTEALLELEVGAIHYTKPGDVVKELGITLEFVPAYNIDKYNPSQPDKLMHPPEAKWTGVIVDFDGKARIYHTGATDNIPEIKQVICDIVFLPVIGGGGMTAVEAAEAVESIKESSELKYAIPMHYILASYAEEFAANANCTTVILKSN